MTAPALDVIDKRSLALRVTREFFWERGFREIDTPLLSPALIPEPTIEVFRADYYNHLGVPRPLYLIPSPELFMKRLLALGGGDIFQIAKCFRNREPPTGTHHPEFTMLEWYAVGKDYRDNAALQEKYFDVVRIALDVPETVTVRGRTVNLTPPFARLSMREAFRDLAGLDLDELFDFDRLSLRAARHDVVRSPGDDWESLFHKLFLQAIEPHLPTGRPLFLFDYPAALPTLAGISSDGRYAERWELFIAGLEIANCYTEETDPEHIKKYFKTESGKKGRAFTPHPADTELEQILIAGLPANSGNALGIDRLLMVLLQKNTIQEVIPFAWHGEA